ncbi:MAG TPA: hypothetical protein VFM01_05215 [Nakamurella sp.]|nr:hypothetical protein [Nakamurella sp.]
MNFGTGQEITLISRTVTGRDAYGNDVYSETRTTVTGGFAPGGSSELVQGQDIVITQPRVYLPPGTVVTSVDAIEVAGVRYDVDGTPSVWVSPLTGWDAGVVVQLLAVTG